MEGFISCENLVLGLVPIIFSYLMGSLNFSIFISRFFGDKRDIRSLGSNNAGFSNMLRSVGIIPSILTFVGDFSKGIISMVFSMYFCSRVLHQENFSTSLMVAELMCCIGHIYPCFFKFRGGKGILATWACIFFIDWKIAISLIIIFLISLIFSKIISLSSIIVTMSYPILTFIFSNNFSLKKIDFIPSIISFLISSLIIYKHKPNIKRLISKEEKQIQIFKKI